jgi:hypothetical protein
MHINIWHTIDDLSYNISHKNVWAKVEHMTKYGKIITQHTLKYKQITHIKHVVLSKATSLKSLYCLNVCPY